MKRTGELEEVQSIDSKQYINEKMSLTVRTLFLVQITLVVMF